MGFVDRRIFMKGQELLCLLIHLESFPAHLIGLRRPLCFSQGRKQALLFRGMGWVAHLALSLSFLADQKGAPCHPGQDSTILHLCSLRQSPIRPVVMQADGLLLAIKTADTAQPIARMFDHRSSLESQAARSSIGFAFSPFGCLQTMELAAMQPRRDDVPQSGTGRLFCPTDGCRQHPGIDGMGGKGLQSLAFCLLQAILLPKLFRLIPLSKMNGQAHFP